MFFCGFFSFAGYQFMKSVQMSFVILTLFIFTANVKGQSIISGPSNVVSTVGKTAKFDCTADFAGGIETMQWQFNNDIIYAYEKGQEVFPRGRDKYSVKQDGKMFNLTVNNVGLSSGGEYSCRLITNSTTALLTVLGTPEISTSSPNLVAGSEVEYICQAQFTGPSNSEKFPQLKMFFDGEELILPTEKQQLEGPNNWYQLTQTYLIIPDASTDGKNVTCDLGTLTPQVHIKSTTEVTVLYWVHDVSYTPIKKQYNVGTVINCTADGRPKPHFKWRDNKNEENLVKGPSLAIKQEMLGSNSWTCIAGNTIGEKPHEKIIEVDFQAVDPRKGFHDDQSTGSDNDSWKIGVGVAVAVAVCLVAIIGTLMYCRAKGKKKNWRPNAVEDETVQQEKEDSRKSMNDDNQHMLPLLSNKDTEKAQIAMNQTSNPKFSEESVKMITERKEEQHTMSEHADHQEENPIGSQGSISKPRGYPYSKGSGEHLKDKLKGKELQDSQSRAPPLTSRSTTDVDDTRSKPSRPVEDTIKVNIVKEFKSVFESGQSGAPISPSTKNNIHDDAKGRSLNLQNAGGRNSEVNSTTGANVLDAKARDNIKTGKTSNSVTGAQASQGRNQAEPECLDSTISTPDDTVQHDSNSSYKLPSVASMRDTFQGSASSDANLKGKLSSFQANNRQMGHNNDRDDVLCSQAEIAKEDCFHWTLPIELREILLKKDGDFLITKGSNGKDYELSFSLGGKVEISPLKYEQGKWRLDERKDYDSIQNLVSSLSGQQSLLAGKNVLLKRVVELHEWELTDTNDVVLDRGLPDSKFGEVSGGTLKGEKVAVKILKQAASENERQTSFNDIYFLMHYNHKNIARFMGITVSKQPHITVMEPQCKDGLLNFLYQHKKKLRSIQLLKMCEDVADGVEYLRKNNIIHRDLAARNCLVGKDDTVKIYNFFMAREVKEGEEYQADKSEPVQVRWAAPEILEHRKYSTYSDIWSLGVLMWEIYSYGETPYEGVAENDILYRVTKGNKLAIPDGTPNEIFQLMQECWMVEEKKTTQNVCHERKNSKCFQEVPLEFECSNNKSLIINGTYNFVFYIYTFFGN